MPSFRELWLRWKTRKWRPEDHDMCLSFMGPCIAPSPSCTERLHYLRLRSARLLPSARTLRQ